MQHEDDHFFKEAEGFSTFVTPPEDNQTNYYNEYCRLYLANFVLTSQMKQIIKQKQELEYRLYRIEERQYEQDGSQIDDKNKRHRRTANEISRFHKCLAPSCTKSYGSEGSLNQHMKLKHPELVQDVQDQQISVQKAQNQKQNQNYHNTQKICKINTKK